MLVVILKISSITVEFYGTMFCVGLITFCGCIVGMVVDVSRVIELPVRATVKLIFMGDEERLEFLKDTLKDGERN